MKARERIDALERELGLLRAELETARAAFKAVLALACGSSARADRKRALEMIALANQVGMLAGKRSDDEPSFSAMLFELEDAIHQTVRRNVRPCSTRGKT